MPQSNEIPIPRAVANDPKAFELARLWIVAGGGQHVSLTTNIVGDHKAWGVLLVNLAKHVANAYQQARGTDPTQTLSGIKAAFDAEWANPATKPVGELAKPPGANP